MSDLLSAHEYEYGNPAAGQTWDEAFDHLCTCVEQIEREWQGCGYWRVKPEVVERPPFQLDYLRGRGAMFGWYGIYTLNIPDSPEGLL